MLTIRQNNRSEFLIHTPSRPDASRPAPAFTASAAPDRPDRATRPPAGIAQRPGDAMNARLHSAIRTASAHGPARPGFTAGTITTNNATDSFHNWATQMMRIDAMLLLAAIASMNKRTLLSMGFKTEPGTGEITLNKLDDLDIGKVARSTPEMQAYVLFSSLRTKLFKGYVRQTFTRGALRILNALFDAAREDFDTASEPDSAVAIENRRKMLSFSAPKSSEFKRWAAIRQLQSAETNLDVRDSMRADRDGDDNRG